MAAFVVGAQVSSGFMGCAAPRKEQTRVGGAAKAAVSMRIIIQDKNSYRKYQTNTSTSKWDKLLNTKPMKRQVQPNPPTNETRALNLGNTFRSPAFKFLGTLKRSKDPSGLRLGFYGRKADDFMARSIAMQAKASAAGSGVYTTQCSEGASKGMAENARTASLAKQFRQAQRSAREMSFDYYEGRKYAMKAVGHICNYEEKIFQQYNKTAAAYVMGKQETLLSCDRYAQPANKAEEYIQKSVQMQMKKRSIPYGVYTTSCADGTVKGMAENARVAKESANFRARQMSAGAKAAARFNARRVANDWHNNGCNYEEKLTSRFPAAASSVRPTTNRY
ncbi:R-phycoerythrin gamma chain, chloroplastic [Porphyridium purpureum]|uniref:R-phycoerythrin gamma chain, chloroplastic n=1 Tax=Porphyridium purpureum TaxID=35688 RepID=A0A5J4YNU6_PORPP|nr:Chain 21, LR7 [Porphyridium purpureum]6KGX_24 Chain 24, LR7 [Porphyridium purpureum]6KGX_M1 Chain M1, LR7 [Porphyridium purpureum]6KGX_M4 Chain M4, LR7 [Porphyridium purpureum]7EZX_MA Chain MA, R-phycoerythrin gamma chain, chloroplastic [Porphyridium purpureum]7EZX_MG Chain MG, R-phycoerythrin gamma chain, chloroplastic [Porphyridium purpureum]7EZX_MN Chain MN, R-phycoerythrin gamma chain, chloroplastic [Porphyridium purpureum]7EZX_MQ Chain MQ, R-phycoerythrin gamma chain, chloroplastic [|eukprot:POR0121..scf222_8